MTLLTTGVVMADLVLRELRGGVAVLSYNRPEKHNALSDALVAEYREAWQWALEEPEARCILLRGEGRSFSSGRDVTELGKRPEGVGDFAFVREHQQWTFQAINSTKPIIAAMKGYVFGGAFERCLSADIRIGSPDALMSLPEIRYGILPDTGGTALLTALVGPGRAKELVLTGRRIDADEALAWGILNRIVPLGDLDTVAMDLAIEIAAKAPLAVAIGKQLVDQCWSDVIHRGIREELLSQTLLFSTRDYAETRAALREERTPYYEAR